MNHVTLDHNAIDQLRSVAGAVQVRDDRGAVIGVFHPMATLAEVETQCPIPDEELNRRAREFKGGRPTADVLADLQKLA